VDPELPANFKDPFICSERCPEGFKVTMYIDLERFGLNRLDKGRES